MLWNLRFKNINTSQHFTTALLTTVCEVTQGTTKWLKSDQEEDTRPLPSSWRQLSEPVYTKKSRTSNSFCLCRIYKNFQNSNWEKFSGNWGCSLIPHQTSASSSFIKLSCSMESEPYQGTFHTFLHDNPRACLHCECISHPSTCWSPGKPGFTDVCRATCPHTSLTYRRHACNVSTRLPKHL